MNGVVFSGSNNRSQLINNHLIGFNGESGVKVEKEAFPLLSGNKIYKNGSEGVLITENSNAVVEQNEISWNIECNIAMGGSNTHQSLISENMLADSMGAGLHIIHAQGIKVVRNDITRNQ